jgi:hypothetical protein
MGDVERVNMSGEPERRTRFHELEKIFSINFVHVKEYIL